MHSGLLDRSLQGLKALRQHVSFSAKIREQVGRPSFDCQRQGNKCFDIETLLGKPADATSWRVMDHCTTLIRAYALFESFVTQLLSEYLVFLSSSYKLSELGADFVVKYTRGVGQILLEQDRARYESIDVPTLIASAKTALSDENPYQIQPEALLRAEQNLRMAELQRLFAQCGLSHVEQWVVKHRAIEAFFSSESRLSETPESELKQIVDYRNEAAHGEVDQVLGTEVLIEVTEFFEALLQSIADFVQYDTLRRAKEVGKAQVLGIISERFRDDVVVVKIANAKLAVGDPIYIFGKGLTMIGEVKSIQLNDVDYPDVNITKEREVGLRLGVRAKKGCELIRFE
jgi:hypothetical protein